MNTENRYRIACLMALQRSSRAAGAARGNGCWG